MKIIMWLLAFWQKKQLCKMDVLINILKYYYGKSLVKPRDINLLEVLFIEGQSYYSIRKNTDVMPFTTSHLKRLLNFEWNVTYMNYQ